MHRKQFGNLGELKIAAQLVGLGYHVFTELGDICKSDLIVLGDDYTPIKLQVKCRTVKSGAVILSTKKAGPNYRFRYEKKHADIYAMYVPERDLCLYVSNTELLAQTTLNIRIDPSLNNNKRLVRFASEYTDFNKALEKIKKS